MTEIFLLRMQCLSISVCFEFWIWVIRICFGFRASSFEFVNAFQICIHINIRVLFMKIVASQKVLEHAVAHRGAFIRSYVNFGCIQDTRLKFKKLGLSPSNILNFLTPNTLNTCFPKFTMSLIKAPL